MLVHLVDVSGASGRDPVSDLDIVRRELQEFQPALAAKPQLVAANKIDALDDEERVAALERHTKTLKLPFFRISGVSGAGLTPLLEATWQLLAEARDAERAAVDVDPPQSRTPLPAR